MKWIISSLLLLCSCSALADIEKFVRYDDKGIIRYGQVVGDSVFAIQGDMYDQFSLSKEKVPLNSVKLLIPAVPEKVFAVGMNFASHLSSPSNQAPPLFLKLPSSLILSGQNIQVPQGASNVHFEGELVLVIGKQAKQIEPSQVKEVVFGVLAGNDLTERNWQGRDLQWMRSKASDGFGPVSSMITRGIDYENVLLTTRLNGEVVQQESTKNMIHSVDKVVSYLSQYFTLQPGDMIFMGTPGRTQALSDKDIVSVNIDGVGTVENVIRF
ncbi:fumarylacetoacetate hydrolase family protein [Vibrio sp. TH_r3]|uniref:fumarylacetoacetate hydrolase family protein n=1 Tax=Vibrio sp. TH_r3 TaxID=3082084 RepID=UPI002955CAC0|nr:fumarylacetoacetate hydrolase family protein [Vibrio sp. TH_r3]MDV7103405.1 fumarylacetoacetate hydrolase family protein [Vibrio sp. TH_r3]